MLLHCYKDRGDDHWQASATQATKNPTVAEHT